MKQVDASDGRINDLVEKAATGILLCTGLSGQRVNRKDCPRFSCNAIALCAPLPPP